MIGRGTISFDQFKKNYFNRAPKPGNFDGTKPQPPPKNPNQVDEKEAKKMIEEGQKESIKEDIKRVEENKHKLHDLVQKTDEVIFQTKAVFPFDFFPDTVYVNLNQVDIRIKQFFFSDRLYSLPIKDITGVFVDTSILFAKLTIVARSYTENTTTVENLWIKDAIKLRRIIQGIIVANKEGIDLSCLKDKKLVEKLEQVGKSTEGKRHDKKESTE